VLTLGGFYEQILDFTPGFDQDRRICWRRLGHADNFHQQRQRVHQRADRLDRHARLQRAAVRPYADEGADELRAYELAVEHLNGGGDGGMLNTFSSKALEGNGILGKKVEYVTGDTQTKSDAARASARSMIEKDGAVMITGGSSSGVAVAVQALCQEAGVIFMAGLTHSNDTTGKDKKANGFRHFFNSYMSGAALAPVLKNAYGTDRKAYHLTADYNWGYTTEEAVRNSTEAMGWKPSRRSRRR
jgi:branched-chain amino acid transport system substrate-binding protein